MHNFVPNHYFAGSRINLENVQIGLLLGQLDDYSPNSQKLKEVGEARVDP